MGLEARWSSFVAAMLSALVAVPFTARADTLAVSADAETRSIAAYAPAGTLQSIHVKNRGPGGERRGYLRFDLSSLPDGANIDKAVLRLWASDVDHAGTVEVAPPLDAWDEKTLTAHNAPALGPAVGSLSLAHASERHFVSMDITDLVRDWLSGAQVNNGVALVGSDAAKVDAKFDSKENVLTSHAPEIEVALAGGSGQGPQGPPGPPGPQGPPGVAGVASIDALAGASCTWNGLAGTVGVLVGANGAISLRCAPVTPPGADNCTDADGDGYCDQASCDGNLAIDDSDPAHAAKALGVCQAAVPGSGFGLIGASLTRAGGSTMGSSPQFGILQDFGTNVLPKEGAAVLVLSSGRARTPGQPEACGSPSCAATGEGVPPPGFPQQSLSCPVSDAINDDVALKLTLRAPANAYGFSFWSKFYSFEYPQYVCSLYNDQFVVLMDPPPPGVPNGNILSDAMGTPVSVNSGFFEVCAGCPLGLAELAGTGFDTWNQTSGGTVAAGGTGWLHTTAPVQPGQEFTLRFILWDSGDQNFDSTALLDGFQWRTIPSSVGTGIGTSSASRPAPAKRRGRVRGS